MDSKRRMILLILAAVIIFGAVIAFLLWQRSNSGGNGGGSSSGNVELTYLGLWEPEEFMAEVIADYEEAHPNISINYTHKSFTQYEENIYEWLLDPATTPDIVRINNAWTYKFEDRLSSVPSEIMTASEYEEAFYPAAINDFKGRDGYLYAIPLEIDGLGLLYNKDLLAQAGISAPPSDWDTFIEDAISLTETDTSGNIVVAGAAIGCSNNINHSADILTALMLQNNVEMTNTDGTAVTFHESSRGEETLDFYTAFVNEHDTWSCALRNDLEMFAAGKLAFMFGPSWRVFDIIDMNPSLNFDTAPMPIPGEENPVYYGMYWGEAVSALSSHQKEAWEFVKYLSEQEQLQKLYAIQADNRAFGEPYSRVNMASEISSSPYVGPFIQMAPYYESWRIGDQTISEAALNEAIGAVADDRSQSRAALNQAATTINDELESLYAAPAQ